jgi:hypothetical protein
MSPSKHPAWGTLCREALKRIRRKKQHIPVLVYKLIWVLCSS